MIVPRIDEPCRDDSLRFPPVLTTTSLSPAALRPRQDVVRSTGRDETKHIINTKNCRVSVRANLVRGRTKFNYQASVEPCWMIQHHSANSSHFSLVCADRSFISLYFFFFLCVAFLCGAHLLEVIKLWIIVKKCSHGVWSVPAGTWSLRDGLDANMNAKRNDLSVTASSVLSTYICMTEHVISQINALAIIFA